jgi:hypothetical protein
VCTSACVLGFYAPAPYITDTYILSAHVRIKQISGPYELNLIHYSVSFQLQIHINLLKISNATLWIAF